MTAKYYWISSEPMGSELACQLIKAFYTIINVAYIQSCKCFVFAINGLKAPKIVRTLNFDAFVIIESYILDNLISDLLSLYGIVSSRGKLDNLQMHPGNN